MINYNSLDKEAYAEMLVNLTGKKLIKINKKDIVIYKMSQILQYIKKIIKVQQTQNQKLKQALAKMLLEIISII